MTDDLRDQLQSALGVAYTLERELGGGGMSRVFVAHEKSLGRDIVVKVLSPELSLGISAERFAREIKVAAMLQEPHIVPIHAAGLTLTGLPYFTMPFVRGESLRGRIQQGRVPLSEATGILRDIARALLYAHARGVVHRDIKPENVLLSEGTAVVTDFGIAKAVSASQTNASSRTLTATGTSIGTPAYMAPEQAAADPNVDHRADLYAWGMIAYELLTGRHAFADRMSPQLLLRAQMSEMPADLRRKELQLPPALADLVMRCLEKDPDARPGSVRELLDVLDAKHSIAQRVMGRKRPVALIAMALLVATAAYAVIARRDTSTGAAGADRSVAVMPFTIIGGDSSEEYLAAGMTDELASELTKVGGLRVAARRSAYSYKGKNTPPAEIGRALHVAMLLDGTVQHVKDRIRVRAQLTGAADGGVLWGDTFEGDARDVFALQDTITNAIIGKLRLTLATGTQASRANERPRNLDAHDLYLRGRFEADRHTERGLRAAIALFQRAADTDSTYALPWVGIADAYGWLADGFMESGQAYTSAKAAVTHAITLAPTLAEAHAVLAWILLAYDWNLAAAEDEGRRAVTLDPASPLAHSNYSYALTYRYEPDSGIAEMRRAIALDPLSASLSANLEWHLVLARRYADVIEQHKVTKRLDPLYYFGDSWVAIAHRELGHYEESIAAYRAVASTRDEAPLPGLAVTYARMGDTARARAMLKQLLALPVAAQKPDGIAQIYAALGDRDRAFEWLDRAYRARSNSILEVAFSPAFDSLHSDPRYHPLVRKLGLDR
ncbi:MAG: protein kinase [bacterium]